MIWQPTMRIWASDAVKVDPKELEDDAMEGVESTNTPAPAGPGGSGTVDVTAVSVAAGFVETGITKPTEDAPVADAPVAES